MQGSLRSVICYRKECFKWICILICPTLFHLLLCMPLFPQPQDHVTHMSRKCLHVSTNPEPKQIVNVARPGRVTLSVAFFCGDARWSPWLPICRTPRTTAAAGNLFPSSQHSVGCQSWTELIFSLPPSTSHGEDGENIQFTLGHQRGTG